MYLKYEDTSVKLHRLHLEGDVLFVHEFGPYYHATWIKLEPDWNEIPNYYRYTKRPFLELDDGRKFTSLVIQQFCIGKN